MKKNGQRNGKAISAGCCGLSYRQWLAKKIGGCALSLLALLLLVSCGGGGDTVADGGIGGTGTISVGTISALGSIFVNGIEFDTNTAVIDLNGASAGQSSLRVGMVVTVEGTLNEDGSTGIATSVTYDDNLQGPISAVDPAAGSLTVLDQEIRTDEATVFDTGAALPGLAGLSPGDVIEVSGLTNADGSILATRISQGAGGQMAEITGQISSATATTFQINNLTVEFSGASQGMPRRNAPQNGETVEVRGFLDNDGILVASQLQMKSFSGDNRQMQLEGYVQTMTGNTFTVAAPMGALTVKIDQQTVFTAGTAADLGAGVLVEVTGSMYKGTLTAREIYIMQ